jgi:hypothetical protein
MMSPLRVAGGLAVGILCASLSFAQVAISTHSGLLQFTLGSVFLADQPIHKTATNLVEVKPGQVLRTGSDGKAEILLTPGVFLRLDNDSSIRMDSNQLSNTRLTLLSGNAMVECDELLEGNAVAFTVGKYPVELRKKGLYRLDAEPPGVATLKGEAFVAGNLNATVNKGKFLAFDAAVPQPEKFKVNKNDDLYAFSKARSEDSVYATGVSSSSLYTAGYTGCTGSAWYLMSGVGMYSYLPCQGMFSNPFGYAFLGLNYGYLWDGPGYYMAPYGYYGGYYGAGYYGAPGGGYVAGGGGGAAPGHTGRQEAVNAAHPGTATRAVPVYVGPGMQQTRPAPAIGSHNSAPQNAAFRSMAGPSVRNSAAFRNPGSSMRATPDPFGGGMPSAAGSMGAPGTGSPSAAPSPTMRSAPTTMTSRPAPTAAPAGGGGGGGGGRGGYSGGGTPGGVRGK